MSTDTLNELMERANTLSSDEKRRLAAYLSEHDTQTMSATPQGRSDATDNGDAVYARLSQYTAWLKAHRAEYAEQYVALAGDRLVGQGATFREAEAVAKRQGVEKPFVVYVFGSDSLPFGGW